MRYIGSKTWCLERLAALVARELPDAQSICDPFAGTCTVAKFFKSVGFSVRTGDLLSLSYAFQIATVRFNRPPTFNRLRGFLGIESNGTGVEVVLSYLNELPGRRGWITRNYSVAGPSGRKFFTRTNAEKLDAILAVIRKWSRLRKVSENEKWYLIACAIDAADRVANTAGTYYAYLKNFYRKAKKPLMLRPFEVFDNGERNNVGRRDAVLSVRNCDSDVLYLDPPYNERDYGAYYHLPELIANDRRPKIAGESGRPRHGVERSPFCSKRTATDALRKILEESNSPLIILHYAECGLIARKDILRMLRQIGPTYSTIWASRPYSSSAALLIPKFKTRVYVCHRR